LPYADPAKPFAGGRLSRPRSRDLFAQLTPDRETGLGAGATIQFYRALHLGIAPTARAIIRRFLSEFHQAHRDDVLAIRAYLATLPPIRNIRPPSQLHWP